MKMIVKEVWGDSMFQNITKDFETQNDENDIKINNK